jgi:tetratricopeptide (TPR) repeat protein
MELDPLSVITLSFYAIDLFCARRYDDAIAQARTALSMQPDAPVATAAIILSLHEKQRYNDVIAIAADVYRGSLYGYPEVAEALERGYAELGYVGAWRRASDVEAARHGAEPGVAFDVAGNLVMAGEKARALDWLEKALAQRDPNLPYLSCWPLWDPLRSDPRFQAVLRRIGLPQP